MMIFAFCLKIFSNTGYLFIGDFYSLLFIFYEISPKFKHLCLLINYSTNLLIGDIIFRQTRIANLYEIPATEVTGILCHAKILGNIEDSIIYLTDTSIDVFRSLVSFPACQLYLV